MANAVVAVFDEYNEAQAAVNDLLGSGFDAQEVQLSAEGPSRGTDEVQPHSWGQDVKGFFKSLFGSADQKDEINLYDEAVRHGNYVVTAIAETEEKCDIASEVMSHHHPVDLDERSSEWVGSQRTLGRELSTEIERDVDARGTRDDLSGSQTRALPVVEEDVKIGKREVQRGGVRIYQRVTEKPVQEELNLREEHVIVDRVPVDRPATEADFKEGTVELRENSEEPVISKQARVVEEVRVAKETRQRKQRVNETARRTDVQVERLGDDDFRSHWKENYAAAGAWETYAPAYQFGSDAFDQYRDREWNDVEPDLRRDWETKNPNSAWERFKDSIRYAFTGRRGRI